ncbi:MAG TPA: hypothetical protein VGM05_17865 [Planctomycetaceae bacterium]|jgi:hypothetical protein
MLDNSLAMLDPSISEHLTSDDDPGLWEVAVNAILTDAALLGQERITQEIQYRNDLSAIDALLSSIEDVADKRQMTRWREMQQKLAHKVSSTQPE